MSSRRWALRACGFALLALTLVHPVRSEASDAALSGVANVRYPQAHRISSGALDANAVRALRQAGVKHVINLRSAAETPSFDEAAAVTAQQITYASIPITGPESLTIENARKLDELLAAYGEETTLIHCSSGNRVGALIAVREAWLRGAQTEAAIAEGRRWGLAALEDAVRTRLASDQ